MGSGFSVYNMKQPQLPELSLGDLPEACLASVMEYLDPPEICKLAMLNRAFHGASSADFVWESKLPPNYDSVIEKVFDDFPSKLCKKDIYARLCLQNSFDGGTKKVWLDKNTGKLCLSISSNGLAVTGIDDRRYWNRIPTDESSHFFIAILKRKVILQIPSKAAPRFKVDAASRGEKMLEEFGMVAYLQQTWWFEVDGEVEFPFPAGTYSIFFRLQLGRASKSFGRRVYIAEHIHGWDIKPVRFQLSTSDGQEAISQCFLGEPGKWIHYHVGDFVVEDPCLAPTKLKFSMTQIDCTHTKGGVCLDSVVIYPSEFKERLKCF
ncbi:unnamed protein product [Camellia sinensis]